MLPEHHIDINQPNFIANPYPVLANLRQHIPVYNDPIYNKVFFTRHADISALLKDKRLGRSMLHILSREELGWPPPNPKLKEFRNYQDHVFMDMEGAAHTRIRGLVSKVFTPRYTESLRGKLEAATHKLIDSVPAGQPFNFVSQIAEPLPVALIADLLGIPEAHREHLRPWSAAIVKMYELNSSEEEINNANQAAHDFMALIGELAAERRQHPQDDLISGLAQAELDGSRLTENELRATCVFLLNAGHEATVNGSALGLMALLNNGEQLEALKAAANSSNSDSLIKTGIDELLRYDTPLPMFERYVLEDMDFNGITLKRGQEVALMYISGNRDEARFEQADQLNLARSDNSLLTFGLGTHYCLGAPLARLELHTLFRILLQRLPNLQLAGEPQFGSGFVIRGLINLPVQNL